MNREVYLPSVTVSEKHHRRFWSRVGKLKDGEDVVAEGYLLRSKRLDRFLGYITQQLKREDVVLRGYIFTPLPSAELYRYGNMRAETGIPAVLVDMKKAPRAPVVVEGRIFGWYRVVPEVRGKAKYTGNFLMVQNVRALDVKEFWQMEKPSLDGRGVESIVDSSFDEELILPILLKFLASSELEEIMAGLTPVFMDTGKHYGVDKREWSSLKRMVPKPLSGGTITEAKASVWSLDGEVELKGRGSKFWFPVGYRFSAIAEFSEFIINKRRNRAIYEREEMKGKGRYEVSMSGLFNTVLQKRDRGLLNYADMPVMPYRSEARVVDVTLVPEYAVDMATYSLMKYLTAPQIDPQEYEGIFEKVVSRIRNMHPEMWRYMQVDIDTLIESGKVPESTVPSFSFRPMGGFGEHIWKIADALMRIGARDVESTLIDYVDEFLLRFYDEYRIKINYISRYYNEHATESLNRIRNVLLHLSLVYRDGWTEEQFFRLMRFYGDEQEDEKEEQILERLHREGYVVESGDGRYRVVGYPMRRERR